MAHTTHHGKNIRTIRQLQGIKQELFALKMGIAQQNVSRMESQKTLPHNKLSLAAKILGVSVETIETFDAKALLTLAVDVNPDLLTKSVREIIEYFREAISQKESQINQLEAELNFYRLR